MKKLIALLLSWQISAATYYISPYGNNGNTGTGPGPSQAWKTITYALNTASLSPGDTIYIAPGVYRESVTLNKSFSGTPLYVRGDPRNEQGFTDSSGNRLSPGYVRWTAFTVNDKTGTAAKVLSCENTTTNYLFFDLSLDTGGIGTVFYTPTTSTADYGIGFTRCAFTGGEGLYLYAGSDVPIGVHLTNSIVIATDNGVVINASTPTAEVDLDIDIEQCAILAASAGLYVFDESRPVTGIRVRNSLIIAMNAINWYTDDSPSVKSEITGNVIFAYRGLYFSSGLTVTNKYNCFFASVPRTGSIGAGLGERTGYALLVDIGQSALWFRKPLPFGMPLPGSPLLAFRDDIAAGTGGTDMLGRIRPSGPGLVWGSGYATNAVGPLEYHDIGAQETGVVDDGTYSLRLTGPGDHLIRVPVNASSTTISLRIRKDSTYSGNQPAVKRIAQPELIASDTGETKTMSAGPGSWETLTFTAFTPTRKGVVFLIVESYDTAGNGNVYIDKVTRN